MNRGMLSWVALALVLTLAAAACGDSGEGNGDGDSDTSVTTSTAGGDGDDDGGDTFGTIGTIGDLPGVSGECEAVAEVFLGVSQLLIGGEGAADQLFASAIDRVPSDLRDDIAVIADAAQEYAQVLEDLDIDLLSDPTAFAQLTPEQQQQLAEASEVFSNIDADEAFSNLEAWADEECGDFDPTE